MTATSDTNVGSQGGLASPRRAIDALKETHERTVSGRHHRRRASRHGAGDRARPARDFMRQCGAAHGAASDTERPGAYAARDGTLLPLGRRRQAAIGPRSAARLFLAGCDGLSQSEQRILVLAALS